MKKFILQGIVLIVVIFGALIFTTKTYPGLFNPREREVSTQVIIGQTSINVEKADTAEKRKVGLGGRQALASDSGMLFIFPEAGKHAFWMKGLSFPLDFVWIREMKVVDIIRGAKPPESGQKDETLPIYVPNQPVDMVLEVNAGFADRQNIKVGDLVELKQ